MIRRFLVLILFASSAFAADPAVKLPIPELETLPNGLEIAWFQNDAIPVTDFILLVRSGHRDDPTGKSGTIELLANALERGSKGLTSQQMAESIEKLGASRYINVEQDWLMIGVHGLAPDAPALLDWLSAVTLHPDFPDGEVKREHARIVDRWNHLEDYSDLTASLAFERVISSGSTYYRNTVFSLDEFKGVSKKDVVSFYKKHFIPKGSMILVVGRVNRSEVKNQILSTFGKWKPETSPARDFKKGAWKHAPAKNEILIVDRPGLTQVQVKIGFKAPPYKIPERYALAVGNSLFGEYFNSRLNSVIRDKMGLTYSITSGFNYNKEGASYSITAATRNEVAGQLINKTLEMLKEFKKGPISAEEVQLAKDYLVGGYPLTVSTLTAVASRWLTGRVFDLGPNYLNEFVPETSKVTQAEVEAAVKKYFDIDNLVITLACDYSAAKKSLEKEGFKKFKKIRVKDLI
ncbi:insulinase family protein [bacterium]|nr:insulinase family protein [bacterium]